MTATGTRADSVPQGTLKGVYRSVWSSPSTPNTHPPTPTCSTLRAGPGLRKAGHFMGLRSKALTWGVFGTYQALCKDEVGAEESRMSPTFSTET